MNFTKEQFINMPRVFKKDLSGEIKEITMDDPVLSPYPFLYFTCNRDPLPTDSTYSGYSGLIYFWYNTTSTNVFCCTNCLTEGALIWQEIVMPQNILAILNNVGWQINTPRSYVPRTSPAFSTPYTPSTINDTQVCAAISLTSTLLGSSEVEVQINNGSGFVTIFPLILSGVAATHVEPATFIVPANSSYQLVNLSGTASISSIMELSL
jgi:hypothetical protein